MAEKCDIFISYRREGSERLPRLIRDTLLNRGYSVFYDITSISAGVFDEQILDSIRGCTDFLLILPPNGLDRCVNQEDWVRREVACAITEQKNIIPLWMKGFAGYPDTLPEEISALRRLQRIPVPDDIFFDAMINILCGYLRSEPHGKAAGAKPIPAAPASDFLIRDGVLEQYTGKESVVQVPAGVRVIGSRAFYENRTVRKVILPEGITEIADGISGHEAGAFRKSALQEIALPQSLQRIGSYAFDSAALQSIVLPAGLREIGEFAFTGTRLTQITIPAGVTGISEGCFSFCSQLEQITLPEGLRTLGESAFLSCAPEQITIPDSVTEIGESCFLLCGRLREITLPKDLPQLREKVFASCRALTTVRMSRKTVIAENAFECSSDVRLEYID